MTISIVESKKIYLIKTIDSIVEVEASSGDVRESFGTCIIYNRKGCIITNTRVISYTRLGETNKYF